MTRKDLQDTLLIGKTQRVGQGWWCTVSCVKWKGTQKIDLDRLRVKCLVLSSVWLFVTPQTVTRQASLSMGILWAGTQEWVAIPFSRGIFLTQRLNPGLLHFRQILYCLSHQESPWTSPLLKVFERISKEPTPMVPCLSGKIELGPWGMRTGERNFPLRTEPGEHNTNSIIAGLTWIPFHPLPEGLPNSLSAQIWESAGTRIHSPSPGLFQRHHVTRCLSRGGHGPYFWITEHWHMLTSSY